MTKAATTENKKSDGINRLVFLGLFLPMAALVVIIGLSLASMRMDERITVHFRGRGHQYAGLLFLGQAQEVMRPQGTYLQGLNRDF